MGTTSGECVALPKQYTFKTTRHTEWMEEHLDSLPPSERSRFIRAAIADALGQGDIVRQYVPKSVKSSKKVTQSDPTPTDAPVFGEGIEDDTVLDLESKLDNMDF